MRPLPPPSRPPAAGQVRPALPPPASGGLPRGAPSRRAAWAPAAVALALFAAVGVAVLDDYGEAADEDKQRRIGLAAVNYLLGDTDALPTAAA